MIGGGSYRDSIVDGFGGCCDRPPACFLQRSDERVSTAIDVGKVVLPQRTEYELSRLGAKVAGGQEEYQVYSVVVPLIVVCDGFAVEGAITAIDGKSKHYG